ncbi:MAG: hypothetical protein WBW47_00740, partial [Thermoplasmata archaeon]
MPDGPERDEAAHGEARGRSQSPSSRGLGALAAVHRPAREFPETRQETGRRSALDEPPTPVRENDDRGPHMGPAPSDRAPRQRPR